MALSDYYDITFDVIRPTIGQDSGGAITDSDSTHSSGNPGHIEPLSGNEQIINQKKMLQANFRLYCDSEVDILETDRISSNSKTYDIVFVRRYTLGNHHHIEVDLSLGD